MAVRVVTRKIENGRVAFNQVVMEQHTPPPGVLLVGIDPERGLYVWLRSHESLAPETIPQAGGYSRALRPFPVHNPPGFLGAPVFFPNETIDGWDEILAGRTNTLNREVRSLFGIAG